MRVDIGEDFKLVEVKSGGMRAREDGFITQLLRLIGVVVRKRRFGVTYYLRRTDVSRYRKLNGAKGYNEWAAQLGSANAFDFITISRRVYKIKEPNFQEMY